MTEAYSKAVNLSSKKGMDESLKSLKLSSKIIEKLMKSKKPLIPGKEFDIILDNKPRINQLYIYLTPKKFSKKILKMLDPNRVEFFSMVMYLGTLNLKGGRFEVRLGAIGTQTSDLVRAVIDKKK